METQDNLVKRIQFNHEGKSVAEILNADQEIFDKNEDYRVVGDLLFFFGKNDGYSIFLAEILNLLTGLNITKISELVEYLYRSLSLDELKEVEKICQTSYMAVQVDMVAKLGKRIQSMGGNKKD